MVKGCKEKLRTKMFLIMFHSTYRLRRVGHIESFQLKFAEGLGNYLVTLSAIFRSDRM